MFITNLYSYIYGFISLTNQNELYVTIELLNQHSEITHLIISFQLGQIFIILKIQNFGGIVF